MKIISKEVKKPNPLIIHRVEGHLSHIPEFNEKNLNLFPKMETEVNSVKIHFSEKDIVKNEMKIDNIFIAPDDITFQSSKHEVLIDKKSGIGEITVSDFYLIE